MYICTVMCCAVGTTDQAAAPWIWNSAMSAHTVGLSTREGFCAAQESFETPDMIASDIFNKGPPENKAPTRRHSRIKYDVVVTGNIVGGPAQRPEAKSGACQALST